jgi:general secretion pathway protein J
VIRQSAGTGHRRDMGFTLLELLVSLALLAALLFSALRFGSRTWERSEEAEAGVTDVASAQYFLRREVSQADPFHSHSDKAAPQTFEGASDHLEFMTRAPASLARGGQARIAVAVARREGRSELQVSAQFELGSDQIYRGSTDAVLLRGLRDVEFSYFGADAAARTPSWHETWLDQNVLPELVRVRVRFPQGERRVWPDLVVAPAITVDATCLYDPVTRHCRER